MFAARAILAIIIALSIQSTTLAEKEGKKTDNPPTTKEQKVERRSVSARVVSAVSEGVGIRAEKMPGEFTIRKGTRAKNFKYRLHDPKSKIKLDKLTGSSIYSITEKRYITEAANSPSFELPPGKYKFVVGGSPGAYGSLSFDVAPGDSTSVIIKDDVPEADLPANGTVTVVIWVSERPEYKFQWNFEIKNGVVTGTGELNGPPHPSPSIVNEKSDYRFQGKLVKKRIKGIASQKLTWDAVMHDGSRLNHIYEGEGELELQLRIDQTVVGSETHTGRTNGKPSIHNAKHNWIGKWSEGKK